MENFLIICLSLGIGIVLYNFALVVLSPMIFDFLFKILKTQESNQNNSVLNTQYGYQAKIDKPMGKPPIGGSNVKQPKKILWRRINVFRNFWYSFCLNLFKF